MKTPICIYAYDLFGNVVPDGITVEEIIGICPIVAIIFGSVGIINITTGWGLLLEKE